MKKIAMLFQLIAGSCWGDGGIFVRSGTVTHVVFNPMAGTVVDW